MGWASSIHFIILCYSQETLFLVFGWVTHHWAQYIFFKTRQGRVFTALVKFYIVLTLLRVTGNDWLRYLHYFSLLQWSLCQIRQLQSHESCLFVTESHDRLHINSLSVMLRVFHSVQDIVGRLLARDLQENNLNRPLHDTGCLLSLHT